MKNQVDICVINTWSFYAVIIQWCTTVRKVTFVHSANSFKSLEQAFSYI